MSEAGDDVAILISEVRHEINNSLMAILGYVELLLARDDLPQDVMAKLRSVDGEAYRIREQIARTAFIRRRDVK